jgi:hypothetical protein
MEQVQATAYTHFEAFAAVAEIYMSLWEMQQESATIGETGLKAASRQLCDSLRRGTTRSGRAASWLYLGRYNMLEGARDRAYKNWRKGLEVAEAVGMRYELGRTHLEMGRHARLDDPQREEHLRRAEAIFDRMGAVYYRDRAQKELRVGVARGE